MSFILRQLASLAFPIITVERFLIIFTTAIAILIIPSLLPLATLLKNFFIVFILSSCPPAPQSSCLWKIKTDAGLRSVACLSLREYLIVPMSNSRGQISYFSTENIHNKLRILLRSHSISFSLGEEVDDVTMDGRKVGRASD